MQRLQSLTIVFATLLFSLLGFSACDTDDGTGTGTMRVQMTDAPANLDAVFVDIQSVRIHKSATAETTEGETDEEAEQSGWITILEEPMRVNLLDLRNGNEITLGETALETGRYSQMRLILGENNEVIVDGESQPLTTPSGQQTGTKLNLNTTVEDGQTLTLLVDFDAGRSVVKTGNGMFILKPVLHVAELAQTGLITGSVEPNDFQTQVLAISGEDTLSTLTKESGEANAGAFTIKGLAPGSYDLEFQPTNDQYSDQTMNGVEVTQGDTTDIGTITLSQN